MEGVFGSNDEPASYAGESRSENLNSSEFIFNEDIDVAIDYRKEGPIGNKMDC